MARRTISNPAKPDAACPLGALAKALARPVDPCLVDDYAMENGSLGMKAVAGILGCDENAAQSVLEVAREVYRVLLTGRTFVPESYTCHMLETAGLNGPRTLRSIFSRLDRRKFGHGIMRRLVPVRFGPAKAGWACLRSDNIQDLVGCKHFPPMMAFAAARALGIPWSGVERIDVFNGAPSKLEGDPRWKIAGTVKTRCSLTVRFFLDDREFMMRGKTGVIWEKRKEDVETRQET